MKSSALILLIVFLVFVSAVKTEKPEETPAARECCEYTWKANVAIESMPAERNNYTLSEKFFVQNGNAEVKHEFGRAHRYWTNIELSIPCSKSISADNVKLEWYSKSNIAIDIDESDMGATLYGQNENASVNCITYYRPPYSVFQYGKKKLTDVRETVGNPSDWAKYSIEVSGKTMKFSKNDKVLKQLKDNQTLGSLKKITIHFKGTGKIDWVRLYEGKSLVLQEDFNIHGQSSIVWQ